VHPVRRIVTEIPMRKHLLPCILGVAALAPAASINLSGTVLDNAGQPLQGVKLSLKSGGGLATTNANGTWSLSVISGTTSIAGKSLRQRTTTVTQHLVVQGGRLSLDLKGHDFSGRSLARPAAAASAPGQLLAGARTQETFETDTLYYIWKGVIIKRDAINTVEIPGIKGSIDTTRRNVALHDARKLTEVKYRNGALDSIPTIKFGNLTWMARNLNYKIPGDAIDLCLDGSLDNCGRLGRLYTAAQALYRTTDSAGHIDHRYDTLPGYAVAGDAKVDSQGICPADWRLPTASEWDGLFGTGAHLSSEWKLAEDAIKDSTGMNIGPSGRADRIGDSTWIYSKQITSADPQALFWSSSPYQDQAYTGAWIHRTENGFMEMLGSHITWYFNPEMSPRPTAAFSVRCVKPDVLPVILPPVDSIHSDTSHVIKHDSITDPRDNQSYRTVRLNNQTWMTDPLRYADSGSVCDSTDSLHCSKGRFYSWTLATKITDLSSVASGNTAGVDFPATKGVCMTGWHIPTQTEFTNAFTTPASAVNVSGYGYVMDSVGVKLPRLGAEYSGHLWVASAKNPNGVAQPILFYPEAGNGVNITQDEHYSVFCVKD
jgi:uncharacterized protein (TIGR02145 family)